MTRATWRVLRLGWLALVLGAGGCSLIVDSGRFEVVGDDDDDDDQRPPDDCDGVRRSLIGTFVDFGDFDEERIEMLVVETDTGRAAQRAVVEGLHPVHDLSGEDFEVYAPCMVPGRSGYELRLFVDVDGNGVYTPPDGAGDGDPAFLVPIDDEGRATVDSDTSPRADISEGLDVDGLGSFTMVFSNMSPHSPGEGAQGQRQELHVIDVTDGEDAASRVVTGYHRLGDIAGPDYEVVLLGVLVPGRRYRTEFYADLNNNGVYDAPRTDHAWQEPAPIRSTFTATLPGEVLRFSHRALFEDLDTF